MGIFRKRKIWMCCRVRVREKSPCDKNEKTRYVVTSPCLKSSAGYLAKAKFALLIHRFQSQCILRLVNCNRFKLVSVCVIRI